MDQSWLELAALQQGFEYGSGMAAVASLTARQSPVFEWVQQLTGPSAAVMLQVMGVHVALAAALRLML